jgi:hypothetical protein
MPPLMPPWTAFVRLSALPTAVCRNTAAGPEPDGGEPMADVVVLQGGRRPDKEEVVYD